MSDQVHHSAFTLAELIVITAVSILLLTVGMLATGCGEDSSNQYGADEFRTVINIDTVGKRNHCINNLKMIGLAMMMYANDNKDYIPCYEPREKNTMQDSSNRFYDSSRKTAPLPGNKMLNGGYFGGGDYTIFACPSDDKIFNNRDQSSYIYMCIDYTNPKMPVYEKRMIVGRDHPGNAITYDIHSLLCYGESGGSTRLPASGGNHKDAINVLYLGGHVQSTHVTPRQAVTLSCLDDK